MVQTENNLFEPEIQPNVPEKICPSSDPKIPNIFRHWMAFYNYLGCLCDLCYGGFALFYIVSF